MQRNWPPKVVLFDDLEKVGVNSSSTKRNVLGLFSFPDEIFDEQSPDVGLNYVVQNGPRKSCFDRGVTNVEGAANLLAWDVFKQKIEVPYRGADKLGIGMVLIERRDAKFSVQSS